ncbi:hypothetical protein MRB53_040060 [Persea americana]|nr:hypothetical protein MRB53_040060 [Persea americana]
MREAKRLSIGHTSHICLMCQKPWSLVSTLREHELILSADNIERPRLSISSCSYFTKQRARTMEEGNEKWHDLSYAMRAQRRSANYLQILIADFLSPKNDTLDFIQSTSTFVLAAAAFCSVAVAATEAPLASSVAHGLSEVIQSSAATTPVNEEVEVEGDVYAELEQATAIVTGATQGPQQYPSVTIQYPQTILPNGVTTNLPVTYVQTFATYPENWATAPIPAGEIGLGTLKKTKNNKRDAEPTGNVQAAIFVIPIEMVLKTISIIEPIFQVLPINITQPVTSHHISFVNATDELPGQYYLSSAQALGNSEVPTSYSSSSFTPATDVVYNPFTKSTFNASFSRLPSIGFGTGSILNYGTGARVMNGTGLRNDINLYLQPTSNRNTTIDVRLIMTGIARPTAGNHSLVVR